MKYLKYISIPIMLFLIYFFFLRSPGQKEGRPAPDFSTELIDGTPFKLSELKGNYVLLDFWGSWCAPCRRDNPKLVRLHNEFKDSRFKNAEGFRIVTVALEKDNRRWEKAAQKDGFSWKHQIVTTAKVVLLSPIAQKFNVSEVPTKFLIDPEGNIIGVNQSYDELAAFLNERIM
ncbi:MAG: TlpA family protein disulfide reductase [Saprospiraceae bacterium]|nr:TlpA family protein disulfide reductase [Saprospiraceae bacterium]